MCDCRWTEIIIAVVVIVFSVIWSASWTNWVIFVAALVLLVHALTCKNCRPRRLENTATKKRKR